MTTKKKRSFRKLLLLRQRCIIRLLVRHFVSLAATYLFDRPLKTPISGCSSNQFVAKRTKRFHKENDHRYSIGYFFERVGRIALLNGNSLPLHLGKQSQSFILKNGLLIWCIAKLIQLYNGHNCKYKIIWLL